MNCGSAPSVLAHGRKRELIEGFIQTTVLPTLPVLDYDSNAGFWHATERARLQQQGITSRLCGWTNRGGMRGQSMHYGYWQSA